MRSNQDQAQEDLRFAIGLMNEILDHKTAFGNCPSQTPITEEEASFACSAYQDAVRLGLPMLGQISVATTIAFVISLRLTGYRIVKA